MSERTRGLNPAAKPSGQGCVECLATDSWWLHLRRCAECGHIGCCDSSINQHARHHAEEHHHPIAASFEPHEDWFYDYERQQMVDGIHLQPPRWHPDGQPVPGPAGRVPRNWETLLR
jgi:Zn-finger in ubiquitin-hydrolases and other protein